MGDCFFWWQAFIGERLSFQTTVKRLIQEGKVPEDEEMNWYATSLILSNMINPQSLSEEERNLLIEIDRAINGGLSQLLEKINRISEVIFQGIMAGYQEAMMPYMAEGMILGEAIIPELIQELKMALRSSSYETKKRAVLDVLKYMVDCAKGTKERFKEEFGKIVKEALAEALDKMGKGEIDMDNLEVVKGMIKEKIKEKVERRYQIQMQAVKQDIEGIMDEIYIDPRIQAMFPFLPLLVKAILSQEPALLSDGDIQQKILEYMQEAIDQNWLREVVEEGADYYKSSIAVSPILKIYLILGAIKEVLWQDEQLREQVNRFLGR